MSNSQLRYTPSQLKKNIDILKDRSVFPTLCVLRGKDGGVNHAVTIVGDWIFDGNNSEALPLNQTSLDWCCSMENIKVMYDGVHKAYRFFHHKPRLNWRMYY